MTADGVARTRDHFGSFPASGTRSGAVAVRGCSGNHGNDAPDTLRDSEPILVRFLRPPPPRWRYEAVDGPRPGLSTARTLGQRQAEPPVRIELSRRRRGSARNTFLAGQIHHWRQLEMSVTEGNMWAQRLIYLTSYRPPAPPALGVVRRMGGPTSADATSAIASANATRSMPSRWSMTWRRTPAR